MCGSHDVVGSIMMWWDAGDIATEKVSHLLHRRPWDVGASDSWRKKTSGLICSTLGVKGVLFIFLSLFGF